MGSGLMVYLVPKGRMHAVIGGGDETLIDPALSRWQYQATSPEDADVEEAYVTELMRDVLFDRFKQSGEETDLYSVILHRFSDVVGNFGNNAAFMPCPYHCLEELDAVLDKTELPAAIRMYPLCRRGIRGDESKDNFSFVGHWKLAEIVDALPIARRVKHPELSTRPYSEQWSGILEWLEEAAEHENDIIGVFGW